MSSRALRRAQKELEEKKQLEQLKREEEEDDAEESEDDTREPTKATSGFSAFALLNDDDEDGEAKEEASQSESETERPSVTESRPTPSKSSKKKKKKKKAKDVKPPDPQKTPKDGISKEKLDEIDLALRQLSKLNAKAPEPAQPPSALDEEMQDLCKLLSVDTQHLHAVNEMRRLFGRAAMEDDQRDPDAGANRQRRGRNRGLHQVGIAGAVTGTRRPNDKLAGISLRRNIFILGKEEWPKGTAAGLGMEITNKDANGVFIYKYVHSTTYQDVQRQFNACVSSMDPQRMVNLLQYNPYHISTLLQVSDIAKQEGDHTTSGDLLERALFTFGRSVHSTFSKKVSEGKARLDFRCPENREFWLAAWRYIGNLSMRATWRTVFEWAKLLLALDPDGDPYQIRLVIDQYAIRGRQPQQLIQMFEDSFLEREWDNGCLPNVNLSVGLALVQTNNPTRGRKVLQDAIQSYPWVAARLFQELNLEPIPPSIWGRTAPTALHGLYTELYAIRAKDIWNTPEATSLLMEVAHSALKDALTSYSPETYSDHKSIDADVARHVLMTDKPQFIALIPPELTRRLTSVSDPLPPEDNRPSYSATPQAGRHGDLQAIPGEEDPAAMLREYYRLQEMLRGIVPDWGLGRRPDSDDEDDDDNDSLPELEDVNDQNRQQEPAAAPPPQVRRQPQRRGPANEDEQIIHFEAIEQRLAAQGMTVEDLMSSTVRLQTLGDRISQIARRRAENEVIVDANVLDEFLGQIRRDEDDDDDSVDDTDDEMPALVDADDEGTGDVGSAAGEHVRDEGSGDHRRWNHARVEDE